MYNSIAQSVLLPDRKWSIHTHSIVLEEKQINLIETTTKLFVLIMIAIFIKQVYYYWKLIFYGNLMDINDALKYYY